MFRYSLVLSLCVFFLGGKVAAQEKGWRAGVAKTVITPRKPMWMSGYASRTKPAEGKINDLWAKACVLESPRGQQVILLTLDLVGIDQGLSRQIHKELAARHGWKEAQVMLACSHTHSGPVVGTNLRSMYILEEDQQKLIDSYTRELVEKVIAVAGQARADLASANLSWAIGQAAFAVNRRNNKEAEIEKIRKEGVLKGPVDHDVPVMAIHSPEGILRGILFGYACHATVLSGYEWCGDYPGFAMDRLEQDHKGTVALFWAGCGADQNPLPRRTVALARHYGEELAEAVNDTLKKPMRPLKGQELQSVRKVIPLAFDHLPTREQLARDALGKDRYVAARARLWLDRIKNGEALPESYPYPVQVWQLGEELTWVALGGEVVVDFSLRLKKELGPGTTWVAGYANDVMAYIPSLRVLKEGGYEGGGAMVFYGQPGVWSAAVEEDIVGAVRKLVKE